MIPGRTGRLTSFYQTLVSSTIYFSAFFSPRQTVRRSFLLQDAKYEAFIDQLDKYSKQGIPHVPKYPQGQNESIDALYKLEDDWRDIIDYSGK